MLKLFRASLSICFLRFWCKYFFKVRHFRTLYIRFVMIFEALRSRSEFSGVNRVGWASFWEKFDRKGVEIVAMYLKSTFSVSQKVGRKWDAPLTATCRLWRRAACGDAPMKFAKNFTNFKSSSNFRQLSSGKIWYFRNIMKYYEILKVLIFRKNWYFGDILY